MSLRLNLQNVEIQDAAEEAVQLGLRDTIVAIAADAITLSPHLTGNNRRSIAAEVSGMGVVATGSEGGAEHMVDDTRLEGAIYSTSGYGGYLETGTYKMGARPYFRPALDMHRGEFVPNIKRRMEKLGVEVSNVKVIQQN